MEDEAKKYSGNCVICGKPFTSAYVWTKTCGREHQYEWRTLHQKEVWKNYYDKHKEKILVKNRKWGKDHHKNKPAST